MINSAGVNFGKPNEEFIIESDGNGALTSARNAVTGNEYVGGGGGKPFIPNFRITNHVGSTKSITFNIYYTIAGEIKIGTRNQSVTNNNSAIVRDALLINGLLIVTAANTTFKFAALSNCTIEQFNDPNSIYGPICYVTPIDINEEVSIEMIAS